MTNLDTLRFLVILAASITFVAIGGVQMGAGYMLYRRSRDMRITSMSSIAFGTVTVMFGLILLFGYVATRM